MSGQGPIHSLASMAPDASSSARSCARRLLRGPAKHFPNV